MKRIICVLFSFSAFSILGLAQQDKGDKEIGVSGAATISNAAPVQGQIFASGSFGKYLQRNQYVGIYASPFFTFGQGGGAGALGLGAEYRYLLGHKNSRIWPFIGAQGGESFGRAGGVWSHIETVSPEFGLKFYASQKTAFEVSYLFNMQFGTGSSETSFLSRTQNYVVFGFKHLF